MKKKKVKMNRPFYYNFEMFITEEEFVALNTRWIRCTNKRGENKYFTEFEVIKLMGT